MRNMLGGDLDLDKDNFNIGGTGNYDKEVSDMAKTSNFGGQIT